jgi:ABC-2 type transport system ATP-binding protein
MDEPVNGLDPAGVHWIRDLLTSLAAQGRVVFVSSHLISEMALMAERLVVIGQGRLLADTSVAEMSAGAPSLEAAFLAMTEASTEYRAAEVGRSAASMAEPAAWPSATARKEGSS